VINAKTAIQQGIGYDIKIGLAIETLCNGNILKTGDRLEGLSIFREKVSKISRKIKNHYYFFLFSI